ncbi:MAG TPA: hypothetical protein VHO47_01990 [Candidatus Babeliales bacterium]|nr:hypothetical protein [Candidatus Babeliales bacterium]
MNNLKQLIVIFSLFSMTSVQAAHNMPNAAAMPTAAENTAAMQTTYRDNWSRLLDDIKKFVAAKSAYLEDFEMGAFDWLRQRLETINPYPFSEETKRELINYLDSWKENKKAHNQTFQNKIGVYQTQLRTK